MTVTWPIKARQVFDPVAAGGGTIGVDEADALTWGQAVEDNLADLEETSRSAGESLSFTTTAEMTAWVADKVANDPSALVEYRSATLRQNPAVPSTDGYHRLRRISSVWQFQRIGPLTDATQADLDAIEAALPAIADTRIGTRLGVVRGAVWPVSGWTYTGAQWGGGADAFLAWLRGFYAGERIDKPVGIVWWLGQLDAVAKIRMDVWTRPYSVGDGSSGDFQFPGDNGADVLKATYWYDVANLDLDTSPADSAQDVLLPFADDFGPLAANEILFARVAGYASNGTTAVPIGCGQAGPAEAEPDWDTGAYVTASSSGVTSQRVAGFLMEQVVGGRSPGEAPAVRVRGAYVRTQPPGTSVTLPALSMMRPGRPSGRRAGAVTLAALSASGSTTETVIIRSTADEYLSWRYIGAATTTATRVSDATPLTEGVHYSVDRNAGAVRALSPWNSWSPTEKAGGISITYTRQPHRYDLIQADYETGKVDVITGTEKQRDGGEFLPSPGSPGVRLFHVLVTPRCNELVPVYDWRGPIRFEESAEFHDWKQYCREKLARVHRKLMLGQSIVWQGYGNSITANGSLSNPAWETQANTAGHDLTSGYFYMFEAATLAAYVTPVDGPAGAGLHHQAGFNHEVVRQLQSRFGSTITYKNRGVGGSTTANTATPVKNALEPSRLAAGLSDAPDVVVFELGMNELGSATTYANTRALIQAYVNNVAGRAEPIVMTVPRLNAEASNELRGRWRYTNNALVSAALAEGVAYLPTEYFAGPGREGFMGISSRSMCAAGFNVHPGPRELKKYGEAIASIFF